MIVDFSRRTGKKLNFLKRGVINVTLTPVDTVKIRK